MKTLEELLDDHDPLIFYPRTMDMTFVRLVGEGFVFPEGFFFYDEGWNAPLGEAALEWAEVRVNEFRQEHKAKGKRR